MKPNYQTGGDPDFMTENSALVIAMAKAHDDVYSKMTKIAPEEQRMVTAVAVATEPTYTLLFATMRRYQTEDNWLMLLWENKGDQAIIDRAVQDSIEFIKKLIISECE